ncbi:hypothetical protein DPMN_128318, partial [Dreissena polymorpha]
MYYFGYILFGLCVTRAGSTDPDVLAKTNNSGNVRLADGNVNWGRVEVFHDGQWGTVCDFDMENNFLDVLCSQLGMNKGQFLYNFNFKKGSEKIWLYNVECSGAELSIENCTHRGWGKTKGYCTHKRDVGVMCNPKNCLTKQVIKHGNIAVKGSTSYERGVKCMPHGEWEPIRCLSRSNNRTVDRVCKLYPWLCVPEKSIRNVTLAKTNISGNVRLADGNVNWGRVEVFHDGQWGTVCDYDIDNNFLDVLCSQLGMNKGHFLYNFNFKKGSEKIWLDKVKCSGAELSIENCTNRGWGTTIGYCTHEQDVGVVCNPKDCLTKQVKEQELNIAVKGSKSYEHERYGELLCQSRFDVVGNTTNSGIKCMPHGEWEPIRCGRQASSRTVDGICKRYPWLCVPEKSVRNGTTLLQCESDIDFNNETWRVVAAEFVESHNCSTGYKGIVTRECNARGIYEQPVYNCTKEAIHDLLQMIKTTAIAETIEGLRTAMRASPDNDNTTAKHPNIHVGDIEAATQIIQFIVNHIEINTSTIENVTDSFVDVVDILISERATQSWGALMDKGGAAAVINVLNEFISKVTKNISVTQQNLTVAKENILIEISTVNECSMIKFPDTEKNENLPSWTSNRHTSIEVNCIETGGLTFSGSLFRNLSSIMSTRNENAT